MAIAQVKYYVIHSSLKLIFYLFIKGQIELSNSFKLLRNDIETDVVLIFTLTLINNVL